MRCEECEYCKRYPDNFLMCDVSHIVNPKSCSFNVAGIRDMKICYNCKDWIGGGDWGLTCVSDYYMTDNNGFRTACERFKKK